VTNLEIVFDTMKSAGTGARWIAWAEDVLDREVVSFDDVDDIEAEILVDDLRSMGAIR
jgi:hypothetical protein